LPISASSLEAVCSSAAGSKVVREPLQLVAELRHALRDLLDLDLVGHPYYAPWHFLNFLPEPHQHGSLRPILSRSST
jgi:hypothetical protein